LFANTEGATPFRLSLHVGDVGHTLVVGPTGAGKSVLLALLALQFRRYPGARIFAFDFGGSIRAAALAMGGDWHDLGGALSDDAMEPVALQPLAAIDDTGERAWADLRQGVFVQWRQRRPWQRLQWPTRMGAPDAAPASHEPRNFCGGPRHPFRRSRRSIDLRQPEGGGPLMLFRRPSVRYGRTPEPETPYQKAAQAWDERIGAARVQARNWRLIAFGNLLLAGTLAGGLIWQAARGTVTPWVVEIDKLGQAQAVSPAIADYRPTDPQVAWYLARFIENVRSLPADPVIVRQNWLSAYDFITDKGAVALSDYARTSDPFAKVGKIQVAVDISSVIRASNDSFRIAWIERRYENASLAATERWTAILTVVFDTPHDAERLRKNPLGVFVHAINWSKELG
jgi:type IV secretion system protein TrbF